MHTKTDKWEICLHLIEREVVPALGCTEPVAVALAAAKARSLLEARGPVEAVALQVSRNILKNAMSVIIPGTRLYGAEYAAALGAAGGDSTKGLEVLAACGEGDAARAKELVEGGKVKVSLSDTIEPLYIAAEVQADGHRARAVICGSHDHFVRLERDGEVLLEAEPVPAGENEEQSAGLAFRDVFDFAMGVPLARLDRIRQAVELNSALSQDGLEKNYGLLSGKTMKARLDREPGGGSLTDNAVMRTLGAIDARMDGSTLAAMSNSGSGNQGITATVPVWSVARDMGADDETMLRAVTFSHITAIYIKEHLDRLSSLCGAIVAAVGAASAITWLLGGDFAAVERTVINTIATATGMICDGAKAGCALKVSTALQTGFSSLYLALEGSRVNGLEGIVAETAEQTIDNLGRLTRQGMRETDKIILDIMLDK